MTQAHIVGSPGHTYYRKRLADGDSTNEALRCLNRRLARTVYKRLYTDEQTRHRTAQHAAAA